MKKFPTCPLPLKHVLENLDSPLKIQDYLSDIPWNFDDGKGTLRSPLQSVIHEKAHCFEGALIAAAALWFHGHLPLLMDLRTIDYDDDSHVLALFKERGRWGAISKTNHATLRYRDPVYKTPRELAMSYFNEYFLEDGRKTLRSFSDPFNLLKVDSKWLTTDKNLWDLDARLEKAFHQKIAPAGFERHLRKSDSIEIKILRFTDWKKRKKPPR